jgi:hypothetical protein
MRRISSWLVVAALAIAATPHADARTEKVVGWTQAKVFPAAVRFLRVDEGVKIVEKDADAGYVLFELKDEGKVFPGALELVTVEKDGVERVKLVLRIEDRPEYMEAGMLERLERKLRDELGPPPRREAPKPPPEPEPAPAPEAPSEK